MPEPPPGKDVVLEIDVQGARQVLDVRPKAVVVLLEPPSESEQAARLRGRGDPEEHVSRRIELGRQELAAGRALASATLMNDDLEQTVGELLAIIEAARGHDARPEEPGSPHPPHEGA
jgi:guanylate kinase